MQHPATEVREVRCHCLASAAATAAADEARSASPRPVRDPAPTTARRSAWFLAGPAWIALLGAPQNAATDDRPHALEPVVVTAQKRSQLLNDLGLAATVFAPDTLRRTQMRTADDVAGHDPAVTLNKPFGNANPVFVIRGVGLQDYNTNNAPNIGLYIDESHLPSTAMGDFAVFDLERVEVLKGPQVAVWGRNAMGGAVSFVTRRPHGEFEAEAALGAGSRRTLETRGTINVPLMPRASVRLAVRADRRDDGRYRSRVLDGDLGDHRQVAARLSTRWQPIDGLRADLRLEGGDYRGDSYPLVHVGIVGPECPIAMSPPGVGGIDESRCTNTSTGYSDPDGDKDTGDWNFVPQTRRALRLASLRLTFDLRGSTVETLSSYSRLDYRRGEDNDASALPLLQVAYDTDIESLAQEIRWQSTQSGRQTWMIGALVGRDRHGEHRLAALSGLFGPLLEAITLDYRQQAESISAFGQWEQRLGRNFRATLAMRYTRDQLEFDGGALPGPGEFAPGFVGAAFPGLPSTTTVSRHWDYLSWKAGLDWKPRPGLLVYGTASTGHKPGGVFGGFGLARQSFTPYRPEHLQAFEAGLKWLHPEGRLDAEAAAFLYRYRDVQSQTLIQSTTGSLPLLGNVGNARIHGVESKLAWRPTPRLELNLGAMLLRTRLRDSTQSLDSLQRPIDLEGNRLPQAPPWGAQATATWRPPTRIAGWPVRAGADLLLRPPYWNDLANQRHLRQTRGVALIGVFAEASSTDERWSVRAWGRNLANERYILHGNSSGIGNDLRMYSDGRSYGFEVLRRWN